MRLEASWHSNPPPTMAVLQHDLHQIQYLLRVLLPLVASEEHDLDDIVWLNARRRFLQSIIAARRQSPRQKIVNLAEWRSGTTRTLQPLRCVA